VASLRQTSFAAGELSPLLWGRTDVELYRHGLRKLRDFFVTRHGMAMSRPGTKFCGQAYANALSRLVTFRVTDESGYLLEFSTTGSLRVWRNGAVVAGPIAYPWASTPVADLRFVQSGDVLTICAKYDVYELRRTGPTSFAFNAMSFTRPSPEWVRLPDGAKTTVPYLVESTLLAATTTTPKKPWRWWVSVMLRDSAGRVFESEGYEITEMLTSSSTVIAYSGTAAVGVDRPVTISRKTTGTLWAGTRVYEVLGFNYYRGVGDYSGFIGAAKQELDFVDDGREPDYSLPHPRSVDPFTWTTPSGVVTDWPLSVTYFEDRLVFGGTFYRPASLLASESGAYIGWQKPAVVLDDQALEFELAVRKRETIRDVMALRRLLVLTDAGVWAVGGEGALTPTNVRARLVSEVGAAKLSPVVVGDDLFYVRNRGAGLRVLRASENAEGLYSGGDVSWHAKHLFEAIDTSGRQYQTTDAPPIVDFAWAEEPWHLLWAVRADGKLLSAQWNGATAGFSLHQTGAAWGDRFEAVAVVPEGDEDAVYVVVQRSGNFQIERLATRLHHADPTTALGDDACLDSHVPFVALVGSPLISVGGIPDGRQVWVVAKGNAPVGPITVAAGKADLSAAGFRLPTPNLPGSTTQVVGFVGLLYEPELELLDVVTPDSRLRQKAVVKVGVEVSESKGVHVGQYPDRLKQWVQRRPSDSYGVPSSASEVVEVYVEGGWDRGARVTLKQKLPLPLTVLGVTRDVDVGG